MICVYIWATAFMLVWLLAKKNGVIDAALKMRSARDHSDLDHSVILKFFLVLWGSVFAFMLLTWYHADWTDEAGMYFMIVQVLFYSFANILLTHIKHEGVSDGYYSA